MKKFIIIFIIFSFFSCNEESNQNDKLANKIVKECSTSDTCMLEMPLFVKSSWDKMFVFKENSSLEFVNHKIGFNYPFFNDIARRVIFIKGDLVVYHEDEFPSTEGPGNNKLIFVLPDTAKYAEYSPTMAKFVIKKENIKNKIVLKAYPVK